MPNLYTVSHEAKQAIDTMLEADDISKEVLDEIIENISGDVEDKQRNVAFYIMNLLPDIDAMKAYEKNMKQRRESLEKTVERLKASLMESMKLHGKEEVVNAQISIKLKKNRASVVFDDEDVIPKKYKSVKKVVSIDKVAIKKAINGGAKVKGAHLEKKEKLEIK